MKKQVFFALAGLLCALPAWAEPPVWNEPKTGMSFIQLPKGCFKMGAEKPQPPQPDPFWESVGFRPHISEDELPVHEVCLDSFWIGRTEVTTAEWAQVMGEPPPADGTLPVVRVSARSAREFAARYSASDPEGRQFRLPTEAEWEYACRAAGGRDIDPFGETTGEMAWHRSRVDGVQAVGQLKPNVQGIHDMLGNAWEWVEDVYRKDAYGRHSLYNPVVAGAKSGALPERVLRGGSVRTENVQTRCAMRSYAPDDYATELTGFRLVMKEKR